MSANGIYLIQQNVTKEYPENIFQQNKAKLNQKPQSIWQEKISAAIKDKKSCFTFQQ